MCLSSGGLGPHQDVSEESLAWSPAPVPFLFSTISWVAADSAARNVGVGTTRGPGGEHIDLTRAVIFCALGLVCAFSVFCMRNLSLTCCCPCCMLCLGGAASLALDVDVRRWSASGCECLSSIPLLQSLVVSSPCILLSC